MKCPRCGHWNKASLPHCFKCGAPLNARAAAPPAWEDAFRKAQPEKKRLVFDDTKPPVESIDEVPEAQPTARRRRRPPEAQTVADEMNLLKDRRARGEQYLKKFRENAAEQGIAPTGSGVSIRRSGGFSSYVPDNPDETIQVTAVEARAAQWAQQDGEAPGPAGRTGRQADYGRTEVYAQTANPYESYDTDMPPAFDAQPPLAPYKEKRRRRVRGPMIMVYALVSLLVLSVVAFGGYVAASYFVPTLSTTAIAPEKIDNVGLELIETADGLAGHRVLIPGEEGTVVYIGELNKSFVVVGGVATVEVPDHVFYDMIEPLDKNVETMDVALTPAIIKNGVETRIEPIRYTIDIPLTEIRRLAPEAEELVVNASIYTIQLQVPPNSRVLINGNDESDKLDEDGGLSHNVSVQAIGNNVVAITARAPYCRENTMTLTLYREPMEIPLELDPATMTASSKETLTIHCTTDRDATVVIDTPHTALDTSRLETTGRFSFDAELTRVGNNVIRIRSQMEGKKESVLEHTVYYLPSIDIYSRKAWAFTRQDYVELMNNIESRIKNARIYVMEGVIKEVLSSRPQMVILDASTDGREQLVLLEHAARTGVSFIQGQRYKVYADVSGVYMNMPKMMARFIEDLASDATIDIYGNPIVTPDPDASPSATPSPAAESTAGTAPTNSDAFVVTPADPAGGTSTQTEPSGAPGETGGENASEE